MDRIRRVVFALAWASLLGAAACTSNTVTGPNPSAAQTDAGLMGSGG